MLSEFFRHVERTGAPMLRPLARFFACLVFVGLAVAAAPHGAFCQERLGVVLLHDKNEHPEKQLDELERQLRNTGFSVLVPEMPWSRRRGFDATYQQALLEIGLAVEELRLGGATQVALVGHGLGANAALGYAASRGGVCGLVALAPSHDPERHREVFLPDVRKARNLLSTNGRTARSLFTDIAQDKDYDLSTTAEVYLSFNDPDGAAVMPRSCAALKSPLPLLWVVGLGDPLRHLGRAYAFSKAPAHRMSRYEEVEADHAGVPKKASRLTAEWLRDMVCAPACP
ncbi:alpha/beta hydrolase [Humidesulfovibrio mexicanus]|nr:alpha/beta fold hydrolase [Humidesulfovibrio mexicanus]